MTTRSETINTKLLQQIVMGQTYDESVINQAIELADSLEVKHCFIALRSGRESFEGRMVMQDFVCRLGALAKAPND